jgi:hypothetical protein
MSVRRARKIAMRESGRGWLKADIGASGGLRDSSRWAQQGAGRAAVRGAGDRDRTGMASGLWGSRSR